MDSPLHDLSFLPNYAYNNLQLFTILAALDYLVH